MKRRLLALLLPCAIAAQAAPPPDADQQDQLYNDALRLKDEGRLEEAREALKHLIDIAPNYAGAWMDLALVQCALHNKTDAERLFREIESNFSPSAGILEVINIYRQSCKPWEPTSARSVMLTRGIDSNINQGASNPVFLIGSTAHQLADDYLPKSDHYDQLTLDYARELSERGTLAVAEFRARRHDNLHDQDTAALLLALQRPFNVGRWGARATLTASAVTLGGHLYQEQSQAQLQVAPPWQLGPVELAFSSVLGKVKYVTRDKFDANSGELSMLLQHRGDHNRVQASTGWLVDHGEAGRLGGNRHGWFGSLQLQSTLSERYVAELGWTRQDWHGQTVYSPDLIDAVRTQSTRQVRAGLTAHLNAQQSVVFEWRDVRNKENISLFQYNGHVVQLSWRWDSK